MALPNLATITKLHADLTQRATQQVKVGATDTTKLADSVLKDKMADRDQLTARIAQYQDMRKKTVDNLDAILRQDQDTLTRLNADIAAIQKPQAPTPEAAKTEPAKTDKVPVVKQPDKPT